MRIKALFLLCLALLMLGSACTPVQKQEGSVHGTTRVSAVAKGSDNCSDGAGASVDIFRLDGYNLERAVDGSPVIFTGKCLKVTPADARLTIFAEFSVESVLRSEITNISNQKTVTVRLYDLDGEGAALLKGETYLIFSQPVASVYENIPLCYFTSELVAQSGYRGDMLDMQGKKYAEILEKTKQLVSNRAFVGEKRLSGEYCTSDDPAEILAFADSVFVVKANEITYNEVHDRTSYKCTVVSAVKGEAEKTIEVIAFKDSMELGKEYILILKKFIEGQHIYYTMAARASLFEAGSAEAERVIALCK